eukprot:TRINITY_DN5060_c1_g2_i1.p1 TRINITY_DN5060_c1_g2~~TRINITY_DN5060_c1_g2_i1.p1  ORF type:complete len:599 (+),score=143.90 TRINITY_DN5060_c1_g2_i1:27-1823(+)
MATDVAAGGRAMAPFALRETESWAASRNISPSTLTGSPHARSTGRASFVGSLATFLDDVEILEDPEVHAQGRPVSGASITFNMLQTAMGTGVLSLAGVFDFCGAAVGSAIVVFFACCTYVSVTLLLRTASLLTAIAAQAREAQKLEKDAVTIISLSSPIYTEGTALLAKSPLASPQSSKPRRVVPEVLPLASYEDVGERCFGKPGRLCVQLSLILMSLVAMTVYLVPLKGFLHLLFENAAWYRSVDGTAEKCLVVVLVIVILPLCLLRRVGKMWMTSLLGVTCITLFVVASVGMAVNEQFHPPAQPLKCHALVAPAVPPTDVEFNVTADDAWDAYEHATGTMPPPPANFELFRFDAMRLLCSLALVASSYVCQLTLFPMYDEAATAEPPADAAKKIKKCTALTMSVMVAMYLAAAWSGYVRWGAASSKASSILACETPDTPLIVVLYIGMSLTAVCAFPLALVSCRQSLALLVFGRSNLTTSLCEHLSLTVVIVASVASVALSAGTLSSVLSLGGALTSPPLAFLLPSACYLRAHYKAKRLEEARVPPDIADDHDDPSLPSTRPRNVHRNLAVFMAGVGAVIQVGSTLGSVAVLLHPE